MTSQSSLTNVVSKSSNKIALRTVLVVPFFIQVVITVSVVGWLSFRNSHEAVNTVASQLRNETSNRIEQNIHHLVESPYQIIESYEAALSQNRISLDDNKSLQRFIWRQLPIFPHINLTAFINTKGEFIGAERQDNGSLTIRISNASTNYALRTYTTSSTGDRLTIINTGKPNFDPRKRPYYTIPKEKRQASWGKVFPHITGKTLYIAPGKPVYDQTGNFQGVWMASLNLAVISDFLASLKIGKTGQSFIIERSGELIATSTREQPFLYNKDKIVQIPEQRVERLHVINSRNPLTRATGEFVLSQFHDLNQIRQPKRLEFKLDNKRQFVEIVPFSDGKGLEWLITIVVPEDDFMEPINVGTQTTIILCLVALAITTLLGIATAKWIEQPILTLTRSAKVIASGELDQEVEAISINELDTLAQSFNQMAMQLRASFTALESKNQDLQRLDQLKNEFLANISHEIRTPLNGIIGIAESLLDGATGELSQKTNTNLAMIVSSGRRLSSLINDILDFSKLRHHNLELQIHPVSIREIVELVLTLSQPLTSNKLLQLNNHIDKKLPLVKADENRLQQILYNLIGNAIKFTESGKVEVSAKIIDGDLIGNHKQTQANQTQCVQSYLAITVLDTGIGIAQDKIDCIFDSFEQGDGSTSRIYGGTGLGLAITKKLIELHGGEIWVESTVGVASKFTFTLPVFQHEETQDFTEKPSSYPITQLKQYTPLLVFEAADSLLLDKVNLKNENNHLNILIVDDEPINLQVLVNYLSPHGYSITQVSSGIEAIEIIEHGFKPDLMLLDIMMPRMTGYEVCQRVRLLYSLDELPILMISAKNQVSDLALGLEVGANDYLTKPVAKAELLARIKTQIQLCNLETLKRISAEYRQKSQDLEQMLQELQQTQSQLIQAEKMSSLGQLVAGIAHEINNPVNFIYVNITHVDQYLQDLLNLIRLYQEHYGEATPAIQEQMKAIDFEFLIEDFPKLISSMKMGVERISQIVLSLRTFSRLDEAEYKKVDIHEGIDSTLIILANRLKPQHHFSGIKVIKEYGELPKVECYAGKLNQVFMNILTNAIDALEDRDKQHTRQEVQLLPNTIRIRTEINHNNRVAIKIADNGLGIPEQIKHRIFDPFFTTKPVGKGTGLGMSISYQIVAKDHSGTLDYISSPGQGVEFVIELPLKQEI